MADKVATCMVHQFAFVVTTSEDFGLAPASMMQRGSKSCGRRSETWASVGKNQSTANNVLLNPDSVVAGTSLAGNPKADAGFPGWKSSPFVYLEPGSTYSVTVSLAGVTESASLCGWIDFDRNGTFNIGERACAMPPSPNSTSATLTWTIPAVVSQDSPMHAFA
jgi:hypothetical protein